MKGQIICIQLCTQWAPKFLKFLLSDNCVKRVYYKVQTLPEMNWMLFFRWTFIISNCHRDIVGFRANSYAVFIKRTYSSWVLTCSNDISSTHGWNIPAGVSIALHGTAFHFWSRKLFDDIYISSVVLPAKVLKWEWDIYFPSTCFL